MRKIHTAKLRCPGPKQKRGFLHHTPKLQLKESTQNYLAKKTQLSALSMAFAGFVTANCLQSSSPRA